MMTGHGTVNVWSVAYPLNSKDYLGYIYDAHGNKFYVPENVAFRLCERLNELLDLIADIADRYDAYNTTDAKSLCEHAYDELRRLNQIIPDESGYPK